MAIWLKSGLTTARFVRKRSPSMSTPNTARANTVATRSKYLSLSEIALSESGDTAELREVVTGSAATLAVAEVGVGSLLHGFRVPMGGHFLSLNQGFFMSRATHKLRHSKGAFKAPFYIAQISALLKSLAPAGNKLGPMLSISVQGLLFTLPVAVCGPNLFGIVLGMMVMSLWAVAQPLITLWLFFGNTLIIAFGFYSTKMAEAMNIAPALVIKALVAVVIVKVLIAAGLGVWATRVSDERMDRLQRIAARKALPVSRLMAARGARVLTRSQRIKLALDDMTRPFFVFSVLIMGVFFYFAEGGATQVVWLLLRPLAVAFVFFYLARSPLFVRLADRLRKHPRFAIFMSYFDQTVRRLAQSNGERTPLSS